MLKNFKTYLSMVALLAVSIQASDLEYHGYLRTGVGTNSKGGDQTCFNNQGSGSNEFRLGNECSTYGEMTFTKYHLRKKDGPWFKTQVTLGYSADGDTNWEYVNSGNGFQLREAYIAGGNFDDSPIGYWVGNRFYRDNDVYMNDFYYFADASANGGGIENIPLLGAKLNLALLKQTSNQSTNNGDISLTLIDARINQIKFLGSEFKLWLAHASTSDGESSGKKYGDQNGYVLGALNAIGLNGGFNHFALIYGKGVMQDIHIAYSPLEIGTTNHNVEKEKWRLRAVEHLTLRVHPKLALHASATYEYRDQGLANGNKEIWYNAGIQPVFFFTKHKQLAAALGYSSVDADGAEDKRLFRFTIAPQVSLSDNIWARPVIRAFYTKSFWSRSNRGGVGGTAYANETSGSNYGLQAEVFF